MARIRVILADDHAVVRLGLRMLLEAQHTIEIVGEAGTGREAVIQVTDMRPDIVLMDIQMPDVNGIEATRAIKAVSPSTAVLALTMYEDDQYFFEMLKAGASGYVPKRAAPEELLQAIETVCRGDVFLYPTLAARLVQDYVKRQDLEETPEYDELTPREREVLVLIAQGLSNRDIADRLFISAKTANRHRDNIMLKLNLHSRVELVKYALRKGLIELDE